MSHLSAPLKLNGNHFHAIFPQYARSADRATTFFIERAFGKKPNEITEWIERMERILASVPTEAMTRTEILFVIPQHKDSEYSLYKAAKEIRIRGKRVIPISVVQPDKHVGQFWTSCLNAAIALAAQVTARRQSEVSFIPKSFETDLDSENAELLAESIRSGNGFIGRRRMPQNIAAIDTDFKAYTLVKNAAWHYVINHIDPHDLFAQWTSCMRNTLAHWPLTVFREMGMFNPACGLIQGMEDWEFILRAEVDSKTSFRLQTTEIWYDDTRLASLIGRRSDDKELIAQQAKLAGEIPTLKAIWQWLAVEYANRNKGIARNEARMHRSPHEAEFELDADISFV